MRSGFGLSAFLVLCAFAGPVLGQEADPVASSSAPPPVQETSSSVPAAAASQLAPASSAQVSAEGGTAAASVPESTNSPHDAAIQQMKTQLAAGDQSAALFLAEGLLGGNSTPADHLQAVTYLEGAVAAGVPKAFVQLGDIYRDGVTGVGIDIAKAADLYKRGEAKGDEAAGLSLAQLLLRPGTAISDPAQAVASLTNLVERGNEAAAVALGQYLATAATADGGQQALALFQRGILAGDPQASYGAADLLRVGGGGLPADAAAAIAYLRPLVAAQDVGAMRRTADIEVGEGNQQALDQGVALYEQTAALDPGVYLALGDLFAWGQMTKVDTQKAIAYYQKAADVGLFYGYLRLGDLFRYGTVGLQADAAKALGYYQSAASSPGGAEVGTLKVGDMYRSGGPGLQADGRRAVDAYAAAAAAGSNEARRSLADMLLGGSQVPPDPSRAVSLLADAARSGDAMAAQTLVRLFTDGTALPASYDDAVKYAALERQIGIADSDIQLAQAILGGPLASQHGLEALSILSDAVQKGNGAAVMALATLTLGGKIEGSQPSDALALLETTGANGNMAALKFALAIYRSGYGTIPADPQKALALLKSSSSVLAPDDALSEEILAIAASNPGPDDMAVLTADYEKLPWRGQIDTLTQLSKLNQNAYLYVVQKRLAELGLYTGAVNGVMTGQTIDAFLAACQEAKATNQCDRGPLEPDAVLVMTSFLAMNRSG